MNAADREITADQTDAAALLAANNRGAENREVSTDLGDVIAAVEATGKVGSVTVTFRVEPDPDADDGRSYLRISSNPKIPRPNPKPATYFINGRTLSRTDPQQAAFELGLGLDD